MTTAYLGLDLHASTCTLGIMTVDATFHGHRRFPTCEAEFIPPEAGDLQHVLSLISMK